MKTNEKGIDNATVYEGAVLSPICGSQVYILPLKKSLDKI